jgi:hypothetical protein
MLVFGVVTAPPALAANEYVPPTDPAHRPIYVQMRDKQVLERFSAFLGIVKLAQPIWFRLAGCDGKLDASFDQARRAVTVCYEYVAELIAQAPKETTADGVTPDEAVVGPLVEAFFSGAFDVVVTDLAIPMLGRRTDAVDQLVAFVLLQLPDQPALSLVRGIVHAYSDDARREAIDQAAIASARALPAQRAFNLRCLAYGAKPSVFAFTVKQQMLPTDRAEWCQEEYNQVGFAVAKLLSPHLDQRLIETYEAKAKAWKPMADR